METALKGKFEANKFQFYDTELNKTVRGADYAEALVETILEDAGIAESKLKFRTFSQATQFLSNFNAISRGQKKYDFSEMTDENGHYSFGSGSTSSGGGLTVGDYTVSSLDRTILGIGQSLSVRHAIDLVTFEDYTQTQKLMFRKWDGFGGTMPQRNLGQGFNEGTPVARYMKEWQATFFGQKIQLTEDYMLYWAASNSLSARGIMEMITINTLAIQNRAHRARKENIINAPLYGKNIYGGQVVPYGIPTYNKLVPIGYPIKADGTQDASVNPFQVAMYALYVPNYGSGIVNTLPAIAQTRKVYWFINKRTYTDVFATHPAVRNVINLSFNNPAVYRTIDDYKVDDKYKDIFVKSVEIGGTELILIVDDQFQIDLVNGEVDLTKQKPYIPDYVALIIPDVADLGAPALQFQYTLNSANGLAGTTGLSINAHDMTAIYPDNPHILLIGQMNGGANVVHEKYIFKMDLKLGASPDYPS